MKFKAGDRIRALRSAAREYTKGKIYTVARAFTNFVETVVDDKGSNTNSWANENFELVNPPSIASDLSLRPQSKTILRHLKREGDITPMKALTVYGNSRLAAAIFDLRKIGYPVKTEIKTDAEGHKYSRYTLEKGN